MSPEVWSCVKWSEYKASTYKETILKINHSFSQDTGLKQLHANYQRTHQIVLVLHKCSEICQHHQVFPLLQFPRCSDDMGLVMAHCLFSATLNGTSTATPPLHTFPHTACILPWILLADNPQCERIKWQLFGSVLTDLAHVMLACNWVTLFQLALHS